MQDIIQKRKKNVMKLSKNLKICQSSFLTNAPTQRKLRQYLQIKLALQSSFVTQMICLLLPRLQLAIEHNYKCLVGHPLCQQVFWQSPFSSGYALAWVAYKIPNLAYLPSTFVSSIFGTCVSLYLDWTICQWKAKNWWKWTISVWNQKVEYKKWSTKSPSLSRKCFNSIIDFTAQKHLKLDVPVNRMIVFTGYYIVFVLVLASSILNKS